MVDFYGLLDELGFTRANLEKSVKLYENAEYGITLINKRNCREDIDIFVCGSRGEGLENSLESDIDVLFIHRSVKCFENYTPSEDKNYPVTFVLEFDNAPDGYTMLRFNTMNIPRGFKNKSFYKKVNDALEKQNNNYYLGNRKTLTNPYLEDGPTGGWLTKNLAFDEIVGPSTPFRCRIPVLDLHVDADFVLALPCSFPSVIEKWTSRKRRYDWQGKVLIANIKELEVFVVPVGNKGSEENGLQWRVSMTLAERALIRSFNDTQIKLYAAVKLLVKQELKPICSDMSSYLVKNIIFWVFENTKMCDLKKEYFNGLLIKILKYIRDCIRRKTVQSYTIPSRNLLENKLTKCQTTELTQCINTILEEGIFTLLRCPLVVEYAADPRCKIKQRWKDLVKQFFLAFFGLAPADAIRVHLLLFVANNPMEIMLILFYHVFPIIRETNSFGYFNLIETMSNEAILRSLLLGKELFTDSLQNKLPSTQEN